MSRAAAIACLVLLVMSDVRADITLTRASNMNPDVAPDGRIAIDVSGGLWIVPPSGGEATAVAGGPGSASRPRWSPDGNRLTFQSDDRNLHSVWIQDVAGGQPRRISSDDSFDLHPDWHPDAERLVYARDRGGKGFDLWETDLATGLHWRLSDRPGDEFEPAWSSDGRHLLYVHHVDDTWSLVLRRHGEPEETLLSGSDRLSAPAWRPDGSLVTCLRVGEAGLSLEMVILSQPRLVRTYADDEGFGLAPVSWLDRHRMIYTADGGIRQRLFDSWSSEPVPFRVVLQPPAVVKPVAHERREVRSIDEPVGRLIIRAERLFDGLGDGYLSHHDIVIDGGRIAAVGPHGEHVDGVVIDMGDLTVMPGYIDARSGWSSVATGRFGPLMLATGVTTLVADDPDPVALNELWSGKAIPGPRLLEDDGRLSGDVAALADSMTPGLADLLQSRQALLLDARGPVPRRFADPPVIEVGRTSRVLASRGNQLPAGLALHAELLALTTAGLAPAQALRAAGVNAAAALGLDPYLGRISVGAVADLVFVDGDPLTNVADARNVVAVVRNGRFFSVAGLIERAGDRETVE